MPTKTKAPSANGLSASIEQITPEIATAWLKENRNNRRVRKSVVARYAADMASGDWRPGSGAIVFDKNKDLVDGQHRLLAVVSSGVTIVSTVTRGADPEVKEAIDTGQKRSLADLLAWGGETNTVTLAAAIRMDWRWAQGAIFNQGAGYGGISAAQALRHYERNPGLKPSLSYLHHLRDKLGTPPSAAGAFIHRIRMIDGLEATLFLEKVALGEDIAAGQPVFALRSWLINQVNRGREKPGAEIYLAYLIKAWNAYITGEQIKLLIFKRGGANREAFPHLLDEEGNKVPLLDEVELKALVEANAAD
jgi:hypothetical protein